MAAQRNPRPAVLRTLRELGYHTRRFTGIWADGGRSTVYLEPGERRADGSWRRDREPGEYPENMATEWDRLAEFGRYLAIRGREIQDLAEGEAAAVRKAAPAVLWAPRRRRKGAGS